MATHTTQEIFNSGFRLFEGKHKLPLYVIKAAKALMACRTSSLGAHKQVCPNGHYERIWYNSCKHRLCPLCAYIQIERWLVKQKARLLACDHYHVIFTIPDTLHKLWLCNVSIMTNLLFTSVQETLFELLGDPKYLGAKPGIIASLHTWSQTLSIHPHIHCLVTGGGLTKSGTWIPVKNGYLLPGNVVMALFRRKLVKMIRESFLRGELIIPKDTKPQQFLNMLNLIEHKKKKRWNVRIMTRYPHGNGIATYIARYIRGGPIKNNRIISYENDTVIFSYHDNLDKEKSGKGKKKTMSLTTEQFIQRILFHVPYPRKQVVRFYGLYAHKKGEELSSLREKFGQLPVGEARFLGWQEFYAKLDDKHPEVCPECGALLVCLDMDDHGYPNQENYYYSGGASPREFYKKAECVPV